MVGWEGNAVGWGKVHGMQEAATRAAFVARETLGLPALGGVSEDEGVGEGAVDVAAFVAEQSLLGKAEGTGDVGAGRIPDIALNDNTVSAIVLKEGLGFGAHGFGHVAFAEMAYI